MLRDALFYFNQYLNIHPFLLPLGIIGLWRWSVWLFKELVGLRYKPQTKLYKASVSIVTPVYNENPQVFTQALVSWQKNKPAEIIAVIDYTDTKCIQIFKDFAKKAKGAKLIITKKPGKRPALADGIQAATSDIVALVDSDTIWDADVIRYGLPPFHDKKVAGVGTYQSVQNPKTLAQKIFDIHLDLRYMDDFAFLAASGDALNCLSGRTAFYRRKVVLPMLPDLINETFMGKPVISGDDKRLTYLVLAAGWKVKYQSNSHVSTPGMADLGSYLQQRLRWSRNSLRADLRAMGEGWPWRHKGLIFFQLDKVAQAFVVILSPIYFFISLFLGLWIPAGIIFIWWCMSRLIKMYPHLKRRPQDIFILPFFILYSFFTALVKVYAFFTLNTQGWITRWDKSRMPQLRFLKSVPAYAATLIFLAFLIGSIYLYRYNSYIIPREQQQQLVKTVLPIKNPVTVSIDKTKYGPNTPTENGLFVQRYEVQAGESLGSVAEKFGITIDNLLLANVSRLTNWNTIEPGFILSIPGKDTTLTNQNTFNYKRIYPDTNVITYDEPTNTIHISGRGTSLTLSTIRDRMGEQYLKEIKPKEWYLQVSIFIHPGVTLTLDKSEVTWLKMKSDKDSITYLRASSGIFTMNGVKITSWDESLNDYDKNINDKRSYILVKDNSRMDIYNSELAYLGFSRLLDPTTSPYGVSWRMSNGKGGTTILTGEILNSRFHHNYFGTYTFGATGMLWRGNEFYANIRYGLDPHDDSNGFLVENNKAYDNGSHGIIFSKRCINNTIRNNISYNNKLHGIMLHESSNNNIVENNILYGNTDAIALWHSSNNLIRNNSMSDNKSGVRANRASNENLITNNRIMKNSHYGIYLYDSANKNVLHENILRNDNVAVYVNTSNNFITKNVIEDNTTGIYLRGKVKNNILTSNDIRYSTLYGIYTNSDKNYSNVLGTNTLYKNRHDIVAHTASTLSAKK
ncbi:MAG: right-handed parallel beta-helix repeat-containing protein [Candidatus Levybacteria bacterium]|nr:right-handed parallel beta-helix repeat-containing protein [Candidatus Levybacteria bacterium]